MSRSEEAMGGRTPRYRKRHVQKAQGKKEIVTLEKPKQGLLWLEPRGLGKNGEWRGCREGKKNQIKKILYGLPSGSVAKNPPTMQEIWVQSLGWEDPLEDETATHSGILAWEIPWTEEPGGVHGVTKSQTQLSD